MPTKQTEDPEIAIPAALIDEFGAVAVLRDRMKADLAPVEAAYQKLRKQFEGYIAWAAPGDTFCEIGEAYTLDISARGLQRTVDIAAARKKLGAAAFLEICTVTQSALNTVLPKPQVEALLVSEQTGARSYVAVPLPGL